MLIRSEPKYTADKQLLVSEGSLHQQRSFQASQLTCKMKTDKAMIGRSVTQRALKIENVANLVKF